MRLINLFLLVVFIFISGVANAQTLVINEVSNGPSNTKEWVELLVISTNPSPCTNEVLDLRGWILDDNNGDFASTSGSGVAPGCNRFSNNTLWSAVPVGTLISIYNNGDAHPSFSASVHDQSLTDGNCRITLPINSDFFESNNSLPSLTSSAYPTNNWILGGKWTVMSLNNSSDSFQIRNPANIGVPVFSVSYGNNTNNALIYFSGSGSGLTFYANNKTSCDWFQQANWASGNAPADETPMDINSPQNKSCVGGLSSNCFSTSTTFSISVSNDTTICTGKSATISASGAIDYAWSNGLSNSATHTVAPMSSMWYYVTGTNAGCSDDDSIYVEISSNPIVSAGADQTVCSGVEVRLFGSGASNYTWDKGVQDGAAFKPMSTQTYTVTGTNPYGCKGQDEVRIDVNPLPDASFAIKKGDLSLQVSANTLSYTNYLFTVYGSGNTYDTSVFQMSYEQGNYYNIELEITDDKGCIAKSLKGINIPFIKMDPSVFIPNAFTPDMNEFNSTFGAVIDENVNITSYHLEIYNRWGELLFTSNNRYVGWDGTYHGRLVASGTYVYKILVEFDESPLFNKSDIFTLLH